MNESMRHDVVWIDADLVGSPALYFPGEGFGALYRRVMVNRMLVNLMADSPIRSVSEFPLDPHGACGAGSLILSALGRDVTLVYDNEAVLEGARHLFEGRGFSDVHCARHALDATDLPDDYFDLSWSFDRLQATVNPVKSLREICRVSKVVLVIIPNARNYGQYAHHLYHLVAGSPCDYVGPRHWMRADTVSRAIEDAGLDVLSTGIIDAPWWPGFPELPFLVRGLLRGGRAKRPNALDGADEPAIIGPLVRRARSNDFIECSRLPRAVKRVFAHNIFVLAAKPQHRSLVPRPHPEPGYRSGRRDRGSLIRLCA